MISLGELFNDNILSPTTNTKTQCLWCESERTGPNVMIIRRDFILICVFVIATVLYLEAIFQNKES